MNDKVQRHDLSAIIGTRADRSSAKRMSISISIATEMHNDIYKVKSSKKQDNKKCIKTLCIKTLGFFNSTILSSVSQDRRAFLPVQA